MKLVRDGSLVKKGDIVCELDSAAIEGSVDQSKDHEHEPRKRTMRIPNWIARSRKSRSSNMRRAFLSSSSQETVGDIKIAEAELALAEDQLELAESKAK